MATPRKLNVLVGFPSYGGNGGIDSEVPDIRKWACETAVKAASDDRIGFFETMTVGDTPITMVRNRFVERARSIGADVLLMVDSDMGPNYHRDEAPIDGWKPFWDTSFDFLYDHWEKGPVVVGAPYGGPPEICENVYVFLWRGNRNADPNFQLDQYKREEAVYQSGIQECAALPTGLIMYDIRAFDLIEKPYFYYEYKDESESEKVGTEDVTNTRDISLSGLARLGYNPIHCNWDSWAAHYKPWPVGKPCQLSASDFSKQMQKAILNGRDAKEKDVVMEEPDWFKQIQRRLKDSQPPKVIEQPNGSHKSEVKDRILPCGLTVKSYKHVTPDNHLMALKSLVCDHSGKRPRSPYDAYDIYEIGSWVGESAVTMASVGNHVSVVCIDPFTGNNNDHTGDGDSDLVQQLFIENTQDNDRITHHGLTSEEFIKRDKEIGTPESVRPDMVFIDAEHTYEAVVEDIDRWWNYLDDDGIMVGHDYKVDMFPGVTKAVHDKFPESCIHSYVDECGGLWWVKKREVEDVKRRTSSEQSDMQCLR